MSCIRLTQSFIRSISHKLNCTTVVYSMTQPVWEIKSQGYNVRHSPGDNSSNCRHAVKRSDAMSNMPMLTSSHAVFIRNKLKIIFNQHPRASFRTFFSSPALHCSFHEFWLFDERFTNFSPSVDLSLAALGYTVEEKSGWVCGTTYWKLKVCLAQSTVKVEGRMWYG